MAREAVKRTPEKTRAALLAAAMEEFEEAGFDNTNTNRIAVRAGFAPQTFYRHFEDKTAIFLAVYEAWVAEELVELEGVHDAARAAALVVRHHRKSRNFRRALRVLSLADPKVRAARAESRKAQLAHMRERFPALVKAGEAGSAARLLQVERIADACAEGEFADLGLPAAAAERELARLLEGFLGL